MNVSVESLNTPNEIENQPVETLNAAREMENEKIFTKFTLIIEF